MWCIWKCLNHFLPNKSILIDNSKIKPKKKNEKIKNEWYEREQGTGSVSVSRQKLLTVRSVRAPFSVDCVVIAAVVDKDVEIDMLIECGNNREIKHIENNIIS